MKKMLTFLMMAVSASMLHAAAEPAPKAETPVQLPAEIAQVENEQLPGNLDLEEDDVVILEEDEDDDDTV